MAALLGFALALVVFTASAAAALSVMSRLGYVTRIGAVPVTGYCPESDEFFAVSKSAAGVIVQPRTATERDLIYWLRSKRPASSADALRTLTTKFRDVDAPVRAAAVRAVFPKSN